MYEYVTNGEGFEVSKQLIGILINQSGTGVRNINIIPI